jgi:N-acetylglucosamine-6-sulfatase
MIRWPHRLTILASACLLLCAGQSARCADGERPPNVLVILTDDQRWDAMSCAGHPFLKTPNMDRIANEGVRFTNMFVTTSLCSPSRASMLSGLYAHRHQVQSNFTDYPNDLPSYPRRLQEAGYETGYIGKYHMGEQHDDPRPGFDYWMSHKGQGNYFDNEFNINGNRQVLKGYYTSVVTDYAVDFLKRPHKKPFCLILGHKAPHGGPIVPEPKYEKAFDAIDIKKPPTAEPDAAKPEWLKQSMPTWHGINGPLYGQKEFPKFVRAYLATLLSVDDGVGRLLVTLKETSQLDNTLIIYTSDNGFVLGEHGRVDKRTAYDESLRVPLLVRYPKLIAKPKVINEMVLSIDMAPGILDICGGKPLDKIDGHSWKPLLAGDTSQKRKSFLYEYNY